MVIAHKRRRARIAAYCPWCTLCSCSPSRSLAHRGGGAVPAHQLSLGLPSQPRTHTVTILRVSVGHTQGALSDTNPARQEKQSPAFNSGLGNRPAFPDSRQLPNYGRRGGEGSTFSTNGHHPQPTWFEPVEKLLLGSRLHPGLKTTSTSKW